MGYFFETLYLVGAVLMVVGFLIGRRVAQALVLRRSRQLEAEIARLGS